VRVAGTGVAVDNGNEAMGVREGQRPDEKGVYDREDREISGETKRERGERGESERGSFRELAESVAERGHGEDVAGRDERRVEVRKGLGTAIKKQEFEDCGLEIVLVLSGSCGHSEDRTARKIGFLSLCSFLFLLIVRQEVRRWGGGSR
jgi:hypothetical protein